MSLQHRRSAVKATVVSALILLPIGLFLLPIIINNAASFRVSTLLASAELPSGARVIERTSRVMNRGTGDACIYQALLIVSYRGDVAPLRQSYLDFFQAYAERFPEAQIRSGRGNGFSWGAEIISNDIELHIRPNIDHAGLYLIVLDHFAYVENFDLRCA